MRTGHKTLISMIETAEKRGQSKRGNWHVTYWRKGLGTQTDLGFKKVENCIGYYRIYHWDTLVLEIEETGTLYTGYRYRVLHTYGESVSDARGINAVLDYFGIDGKRYTYKPVNGGFMGVE